MLPSRQEEGRVGNLQVAIAYYILLDDAVLRGAGIAREVQASQRGQLSCTKKCAIQATEDLNSVI